MRKLVRALGLGMLVLAATAHGQARPSARERGEAALAKQLAG